MLVNYLFIMGMKYLRSTISHKRFREGFDKIMELLLRINGFFLGAIGIDMIFTGIIRLFPVTANPLIP